MNCGFHVSLHIQLTSVNENRRALKTDTEASIEYVTN